VLGGEIEAPARKGKMLGRKSYTRDEIDHARSEIEMQVGAYKKLAAAVGRWAPEAEARAILDDFERLYFNNLVLVLDRHFVYRLRMVTGSDGNPINEVEMICDSLMNNNGMFRGSSVIKYLLDLSVLKLRPGERIGLTADDFERLSAAFFADIEAKFAETPAVAR
jgi:hypothetical protein